MLDKRFTALTLGCFLFLGNATSGLAHHSHAMFDENNAVDLTGVVKRYSFMNPHVYLFLEVKGPDKSLNVWRIEMSYIQNMISRGINASTFKVGDVITVTINPLRDGHSGGSYTAIIDSAGNHYK